jgi:glycosyltransferase involved in cell wall biosynthesis
MHILFVTEYFPPKIMGGGEINIFLLAKALVKRKIEVSVLTSHHAALKKKEIMEGISVFRTLKTGDTPTTPKGNLQRYLHYPGSVVKEVKKFVKSKKVEGIHFIGSSLIAAPQLSSLHIPLFATIESYPSMCPKGDRIYYGKRECKITCTYNKFLACQKNSTEIGKMTNSWFLKNNPLFHRALYGYYQKLRASLPYCHLIAISEYIHNVLLQHGVQSTIIPNAMDIKPFNTRSPELKKPVVLYLGSLTRFKGPQVLLKAVQDLPVQTLLYGDGPLHQELQQTIRQKNIDATLHTPVSYDKVPQVYANTSIVVFPSIWPEPFGRIAMEAMAAGKPVVGSDIGGIKETITKETGILVPPDDAQALRQALLSLLADTKRRKEMGSAGRKLVRERYSEDRVTQRLITTYKKALTMHS